MSETLNQDGKYPDLPLTNFPASVDVWQDCLDVTAALLPQVNQYTTAMSNGDYTAAQAILEADSTGMLQRMIINAETVNKLQQALTAIERMWDNDIRDYVEGGYFGDYYTKAQVDAAIANSGSASQTQLEAEAATARAAEQTNAENIVKMINGTTVVANATNAVSSTNATNADNATNATNADKIDGFHVSWDGTTLAFTN